MVQQDLIAKDIITAFRPFNPSRAEDVLNALPKRVITHFYDRFGKSLTENEIFDCYFWYANNPQKWPRHIHDWSAIYNYWLKRAKQKLDAEVLRSRADVDLLRQEVDHMAS